MIDIILSLGRNFSELSDVFTMLLRMLLALAIGGMIGWEREKSRHPAGVRTHILVTMGAAVVMLISEDLAMGFPSDPARLGAGVLSGIGFLGAGTIMKEGYAITGLTTAASLWMVACLGLAAGAGEYLLAIFGLVCVLGTLHISEFYRKRHHVVGRSRCVRVNCVCTNREGVMSRVSALLQPYGVDICNLHVQTSADGKKAQLSFVLDFRGSQSGPELHVLFDQLGSIEALDELELFNER